MTKAIVFLLLNCVLSLTAQDPLGNWPTTGLALVASGDLPAIGKINDQTVFYFNLNENGWDSVYTHSYGYNRVRVNMDGSYERHFSSPGNRDYLHVDYLTADHFLYQNYTIRGDSTCRTFHRNGKLKTRLIFSDRGFGTYEASETHDRYNDEYRSANGLHSRDFIKDTLLFGKKAIVSGKIVRNDTSFYEIRMIDGKVWKHIGIGDSVDFKIHSNGDTLILLKRVNTLSIHTWLCSDAVIDSTFYESGAMVVNTAYRNGSLETYECMPQRSPILTYKSQGHFGEEVERYHDKPEELKCLEYSYYSSDTTHWQYRYNRDYEVYIEKTVRTPSGKAKGQTRWEDGDVTTVQFDTLITQHRGDCGTHSGVVTLDLGRDFEVRVDSLVTELGNVIDFDPTELLIHTYDGWENWPLTQRKLNEDLDPDFGKDRQAIPVEWLQEGKSFQPSSKGDFIEWLVMTHRNIVAGLKYKEVEWNGKSGVSHEKLGLYFHLAPLK